MKKPTARFLSHISSKNGYLNQPEVQTQNVVNVTGIGMLYASLNEQLVTLVIFVLLSALFWCKHFSSLLTFSFQTKTPLLFDNLNCAQTKDNEVTDFHILNMVTFVLLSYGKYLLWCLCYEEASRADSMLENSKLLALQNKHSFEDWIEE